MFLVRRVFKAKPGQARRAAAIVRRMGKVYEEAGQRSTTRVYLSGGMVPGPADTVYIDWTEESLRIPFRSDNKIPEEISTLGGELREVVEYHYVEFYELLTDE